MREILPFFMIAAMIATLGIVVVGIISFGVYGDFYRRNSNLLMRLRVLFQAIALAFFLALSLIAMT